MENIIANPHYILIGLTVVALLAVYGIYIYKDTHKNGSVGG
jgi:hypothetical protein